MPRRISCFLVIIFWLFGIASCATKQLQSVPMPPNTRICHMDGMNICQYTCTTAANDITTNCYAVAREICQSITCSDKDASCPYNFLTISTLEKNESIRQMYFIPDNYYNFVKVKNCR